MDSKTLSLFTQPHGEELRVLWDPLSSYRHWPTEHKSGMIIPRTLRISLRSKCEGAYNALKGPGGHLCSHVLSAQIN